MSLGNEDEQEPGADGAVVRTSWGGGGEIKHLACGKCPINIIDGRLASQNCASRTHRCITRERHHRIRGKGEPSLEKYLTLDKWRIFLTDNFVNKFVPCPVSMK